LRSIGLVIAFFLLSAGASAAQTAQEGSAMTMKIDSSAFKDGGEIPVLYTGEGQNISPPLSFSGVPSGAKSLVLIVDDPDAPDPAKPKMVFVHWVLYNIPPDATELPEGVQKLPEGTDLGLNDRKQTGYTGPMPPIGRHRYFFKLYAVDGLFDFHANRNPTKADLERAMQGHILAEATLIGTYKAKK
jgi:hypothetical protein